MNAVFVLTLLSLAHPFDHSFDHPFDHSFDHSLRFDDVELRPGVTADVHVRVFVNDATPLCLFLGQSAFLIHGVAHDAASFESLANAMFDEQTGPDFLCRVYAIDLPGHGESPPPQGVLFGDLLLQDFVAASRGVLTRLKHFGVRPRLIVAHSQGGLVAQLLQQQLVDEASSLREKFGVKNVVLLASSMPAPLAWAFGSSPDAAATIGALIVSTPELGTHVAAPENVWLSLFFTNFAGELHPNAPSAAQAAVFNSPEPLLSLLQLVGAPPFSRETIDAGIFAPSNGTRLFVTNYSQDPFALPSEGEALYVHLTGDATLARLGTVTDPFAVHDLHVADPALALSGINGL